MLKMLNAYMYLVSLWELMRVDVQRERDLIMPNNEPLSPSSRPMSIMTRVNTEGAHGLNLDLISGRSYGN